MREISEGDANFVYIIKLVPPKDVESIVHPGYSLKMFFIETLFITNIIHSAQHYSMKVPNLAIFTKSTDT